MIAVGVVKVPLDEIVGVIAVRHLLMAAVGSVLVGVGVRATMVLGRAVGGVLAIDLDGVFVDVIGMGVMQMTVVQVVDMTVVLNRGVPAIRAVSMIVRGVGGMLRSAHRSTVGPIASAANSIGMRSTLRR